MSDLISRKALVKAILDERDKIPLTTTERYGFGVEFPNKHGESMRGGIRKALKCVEQATAVDAVPVVRCKDCVRRAEYFGSGLFVCIRTQCTVCGHNVFVADDDFCSYRERRSE